MHSLIIVHQIRLHVILKLFNMSVTEDRLQNILSHVATKCCMKNWRYELGELSDTIENYAGFLIPVTVIGVSGDKERTQHVFVKVPTTVEAVRAFSHYFWDAEAYVYETLVPMWKVISNVEVDELIPECYYADVTINDQALVLKDMTYEGFQKYEERFLDFDHVIVSLKSLAQFHALSMIIKNDQVALDAYVLRVYTDTYPVELNFVLKKSFQTHLELFKGSKYENFMKATLENYKNVVLDTNYKVKCLVYGHGDYWKENILYKYENNKPIKACILDFQCCRVMSPAHDFLFFILNSTNSYLRQQHYEEFRTKYYACLKNTLFNHNIQLEKIYTEEDFVSDLQIVAPLCIIRIFMGFSLWLGFEPESVIKSTKIWKNEEEKEENLQHLKQILADAMQDLHDYELIKLYDKSKHVYFNNVFVVSLKMSNISESYVYEVLCKVASACELTEWSHIRQTFDSIAQNYFGVLIPVILKGKRDGKDLTLHLVLKLAPTDERYRVSGAVTLFFAREIFVYSELLEKYDKIQELLPPKCHFDRPRCYFVSKEYCEEVIAMENMCANGYSPFTERLFLDLDHVVIALKSLAKFHALSFILKEKDSAMYEKGNDVCVPLTNKTNNRVITIYTDRLMKASIKFENSIYVPLLECMKNNCVYFLESAIFRVRNVCLCHGDIWKENIMFKYKDNTPIAACLIDYQTTRMSTPAFDVLYLIITSVDTNFRLEYYRKLIDIYYETFSEMFCHAQLDANKIYGKEDLQYDLSIVGPACFIVANTAIWLSSGLQEEGHVRSKHIPTTEVEKSEAVNQYKTRIKGIIDDLSSYGYLKLTDLLNK
ncbi:uncharacterized protein [Epargyreus clarus]|uniref:uncharacterized protein n=1 Tax=Epargyreus clarus TaxID=520877 RepID=UPI003C2FBFAE